MPRIAGVDIPLNKRIEVGLTYIYGIGKAISTDILSEAKVDVNTKSGELSDQEVAAIREIIERKHTVEGELKTEIQSNIRRLIEIGCYRGVRHRTGLPTRGQKTKSNARTRKGPRGTAIAKKKKAGK
jgi:small subunit ribosomal protein S13